MALAKLSIDIVAKLAEFERDLGKAARASDKAAEEIRKNFEGLKSFASDFAMGLAAGVGATLAGGALATWVTDAANAADELARLSDQTGISVEKLSAWGNVARRNGQDVNDLAELTTEMSLRLAEIDKDSEGAGLAIKQLGLNYKELAALPADEAFEAIAKAVAGTEDSGRKTALVMAALGDEAQKYVTTLNTIGAAGEMEASITTRQGEVAREYKDALAQLSAAGVDWSQTVVSAMLPTLRDVILALDDTIAGTGGLTGEARRLARDGTIAEWANGTAVLLSYVSDLFQYTGRAAFLMLSTIDTAIKQVMLPVIGAMDAAAKALVGDFAGAGEALSNGFGAAAERGSQWVGDMSRAFDDTLGTSIRARISETERLGKAGEEAAKKIDKPRTSVRNRTLVKADDSAAKAAAAAKKKADADAERENARALAEYEKLITSIRAKTAAESAEMESGRALTDGEKMRLEVTQQLADGRLKLTDAQKQNVSVYLEELLTTERLLAAKRQQIEIDAQTIEATQGVRDTMRSRTEALQEQIKATRLEGEEIGLSAKALLALRDARELATAAALEQRAEITASLEDGAAMAAIYRDQAAAIRELVQTQANNRAGAESARKDPMAGARAGLDAYKEQLSSTAADVQSAVGSIAGGLEDAMMGAFNGSADGAKRLFETIKAEALKLLVIKPILQQLTGSGGGNVLGALASAAGTMFGGVGSAGNAGYGDYSAQGMAAAFGRAGGGTVSAGSLHQVNERGPELVSTGGKDYLMMGGESGFVTPVTPAASSNTGRGSVQITYAPQITIDSRSDRGQIMQDVTAITRRGQEEMMQTLKERGIA